MNYRGKRVFITGASSGIGVEFARQFHALGANLTLVARREDLLKKIADELNAVRVHSAEIICADLTQRAQLLDLSRSLCAAEIDILVNNAGRGSFGHFEQLALDEELKMIELNVVATTILAHAVISRMKERRSGVIIAISSVAGIQPLPYMATYAATKAFNYSHALALRQELAPFGVQVLTVCPGPTETEFAGVARVPGEFTGNTRDRVEDVVRESIGAINCRRAVVVPCFRAKLLAFPCYLLPRSLTTMIAGKVLRRVLPVPPK